MTQQQATDGMGKMELGIKRTADILFAMVGMVVLSPVMLAVALSIRLQQNGPIFFRQVRIGKGGKPFVIFKFRTLSSEAENEGPQLIAQGDELTSTRLERFLRGHHLDELPQLWNVLRGDTSRAQILHRQDYEAGCALQPHLPDAAWTHVGSYALQRLHRHDGEDATPAGHGHQLSGAPLALARHQDYHQDSPKHRDGEKILKEI